MEIKKFKIDGREFTVIVKMAAPDSLTLEITDESSGARQVVVAAPVAWQVSQKCFVFRLNQAVYKVMVVENSSTVSKFFVFAHGVEVAVERLPEAPASESMDVGYIPALRDTKPVNDGIFTSPLAGRVVKVLVAEGQAVEQHQPLVVVESMKMENELCAPFTGFIKTLSISDGNVVKPNQVLLRLERKEGGGDAAAKGDGK